MPVFFTPEEYAVVVAACERLIPADEFVKQVVTQTPLGLIGRPDDIGKVAAFLASDDSGWLTGETLLAAGGFR